MENLAGSMIGMSENLKQQLHIMVPKEHVKDLMEKKDEEE